MEDLRRKYSQVEDDGHDQECRVLRGSSWYNEESGMGLFFTRPHAARRPNNRNNRVGFVIASGNSSNPQAMRWPKMTSQRVPVG